MQVVSKVGRNLLHAGLHEALSGPRSEGSCHACVASISTSSPKDSEPDFLMDPPFQPPTGHWHMSLFLRSPLLPLQHCLQLLNLHLTLVNKKPPKSELPVLSPVGLQSGSKLAPTFATQVPHPLREVADGNGGITRVHVPFLMADLGIC